MDTKFRFFVGIDLQLQRGLAYAAMTADGEVVDNGWLAAHDPQTVAAVLASQFPGAQIGIDAPRMPLPAPRQYYWSGSGWRRRRRSDKGLGRHCEVVISACGLARPQWTPTREQAPHWMAAGFALFESCGRVGLDVEEVFPSAAYRMLASDAQAKVQIPLQGFLPGPKDMLDAVIAAFTLKEHAQGHGCAVGGGDGLGTIVLPRPVSHPKALLVGKWPES